MKMDYKQVIGEIVKAMVQDHSKNPNLQVIEAFKRGLNLGLLENSLRTLSIFGIF